LLLSAAFSQLKIYLNVFVAPGSRCESLRRILLVSWEEKHPSHSPPLLDVSIASTFGLSTRRLDMLPKSHY